MGKVNKSKTVTCPFYYVFTAQSNGRFAQILCSLHGAPHHWLHILRIWEQSAYGSLRPPWQLYCHIWSSKPAPAQPSQPSPAQPCQPSPATWHRSCRCCRCEAGPDIRWSSATLVMTHSFTHLRWFYTTFKGCGGSLKNCESHHLILYIHFILYSRFKLCFEMNTKLI